MWGGQQRLQSNDRPQPPAETVTARDLAATGQQHSLAALLGENERQREVCVTQQVECLQVQTTRWQLLESGAAPTSSRSSVKKPAAASALSPSGCRHSMEDSTRSSGWPREHSAAGAADGLGGKG